MASKGKRKREPDDIDGADDEEIQRIVDEAPEVTHCSLRTSTLTTATQIEALNEKSLKKMVLAFEKAITKNQKFRTKYPDDPSKYE